MVALCVQRHKIAIIGIFESRLLICYNIISYSGLESLGQHIVQMGGSPLSLLIKCSTLYSFDNDQFHKLCQLCDSQYSQPILVGSYLT